MGTAAMPGEMPRPARRMLVPGTLEPLRQGEFDHLCGLYAIINAVRLLLAPVRPLRPREAKRLFDCGVGHLSAKGDLADAVLAGCDRERWLALLPRLLVEAGRISGREIEAMQLFTSAEQPMAEAVFAAIESAIVARRPVLVELVGSVRHHSVIAGYTPTRLRLFDSSDHVWLRRAECLNEPDQERDDPGLDPRSLVVFSLPAP